MHIAIKLIFVMIFVSLLYISFIQVLPQDDQPQRISLGQFSQNISSGFVDVMQLPSTQIIYSNENLSTPQDIQIDDQGNIYTGLKNGKLIKIAHDNINNIQIIGQSKGQILGIKLSLNKQYLYFLSNGVGFCKLNLQTKQINSIATERLGLQFSKTSPNNFVQAADGKIYITQSNDRHIMTRYIQDVLRAQPKGSLFVYDTITNKINKIMDGLYFPNGLVLDKQQQSVLIAQTTRYRIIRVWIKGQKKGTKQIFLQNLPGMPDNMKLNSQGQLWIAFPIWRNAITSLLYQIKFPRNILIKFNLEWIGEMFANYAQVGGIKINIQNGKLLQVVRGNTKTIKGVSTIYQKHNKLYFGCLKSPAIAIIDINELKTHILKQQSKQQL